MAPRVPSSLLSLNIPVDVATCTEARRILGSQGFRVDELSAVICRDPTLVMDILKVANSTQGGGGQTLITSVRKAITSLGVNGLTEIITGAQERPNTVRGAVLELLPSFRERSQRRAKIAGVVASVVDARLVEDATTCALFLPIGDMLAALHLGDKFIQLVASFPRRAQLLYRLSTDHGLEIDAITPAYLENRGVPRTLWGRLVWSGESLSPEGTVVRTISFAANELAEAFESDRLDAFGPDKKLPAKSAIRLLGIDDRTYQRLYEEVDQALKVSIEAEQEGETSAEELDGVNTEADNQTQTVAQPEQGEPAIPATTLSGESVVIVEDMPPLPPVTQPARQAVEERVAQFGGLIESLADDIEDTSELLSSVLDALVGDGPFQRAAILIPSHQPQKAFAVASRGLPPGSNKTLNLSGNLRENFGALTKVQSVRAGSDGEGLGSGPYAIAPLDVKHPQPVVLYADCGAHETLGFEARRAFRKVVDILNDLLPTLPGGIPTEDKEETR